MGVLIEGGGRIIRIYTVSTASNRTLGVLFLFEVKCRAFIRGGGGLF